jgi:hypothetical protein
MTMSKTETEPEVTETETTATETGDGDLSLAALNDKVDRLADLIGNRPARSGRATKADDADDVARQVKDEVGKLKAHEDAQRQRGELENLKAQVKKIAEKAPVEYRKVTRWMWGSDE